MRKAQINELAEVQNSKNHRHGNDHAPLFVFLHMPKCAGTTFRIHVEKNLAPDEILPLYRDIDKRYRDRDFLKDYITSLSEERKRKLKLVYGHEVHYGIHDWLGRQGKYFTFLRHPVSRTISWYNYRRQKNWRDKEISRKFVDKGITPTIQQWLESSPWVWNEMTGYFADFGYCDRKKQYSQQELDSILDLFFFVGLTETFDEDALWLYYLLGVRKQFFRSQNISKKYFDPKDKNAMEHLILEKNEYDLEIYQKAVQLHDKVKMSEPSYRRKIIGMRLRRAMSPIYRCVDKLTS